MGHNISEEKQHWAVLAGPLDRWRGWFLHMDCGSASCARGRRFSVADLLPHYPGVALEQAEAALRCAICKGPALKVKLTRQQRGKDEEAYWARR